MGELNGGKGESRCVLMGTKGLGELEALARMGVPHRIGWGHTWLSLAGPELGVETKIREALSY